VDIDEMSLYRILVRCIFSKKNVIPYNVEPNYIRKLFLAVHVFDEAKWYPKTTSIWLLFNHIALSFQG